MSVAWLAGLIDGEGSVGIGGPRLNSSGNPQYTAAMQISMTHKGTIDRVIVVLEELGMTTVAHGYSEKNPAKHRPAWHVAVTRQADLVRLAEHMMPHAVTKLEHWRLQHAFLVSRMSAAELDPQGRRRRGGLYIVKGYTQEEISLASQLRILNKRGPDAIAV